MIKRNIRKLLSAEIIHRLKNPQNLKEVYRPSLSIDSIKVAAPFVKECMVQCWDENPNNRPKLIGIKKQLKPLNCGM